MSSLPAPPLEIADAHHLGHTQTNPRPWDAETTGDCERELGKTRQAYPSSTQRKAAAVRTRSCIDQTTSEGGFANRRDDLQRDANATLTWVRAPQTDTGYITALNWWRKFSRFIGMSSPYLAFDSDNGAARAQVTNRALMFLQFTSRTIRPKRGEVPDPNTSYRYLSMVVKMHYEGGTDIHFVLPTAKKWVTGTTRANCNTYGPRLKSKKSAFTIAMIKEIYSLDWSKHAGTVNPKRRELVMKAIPKLAIQSLFRGSELLRPAGSPFNHNLHITRAMVQWFDMDWTPITPNRGNLRRLLANRQGRALVGIPQLKNDQNRERFNQCDVSLKFSPDFTCSLVELARMEIDDPIVDQQSRAATPLFVDPETGAAFGKETFASEFISLIRLSLLLHHGKRFTLAEVRRLWSLHSFRITGLNLLEKAGCPPWLLRIAGRWLSDCHYQYTRQDHNLLATVTASMDQQPDGSTPLREFPTFPFPVKHIPDSLPQHPDTRKMTQPGQTQVDATLTAEATTSSWLLPGAFNTDAPELMDVPNTMVGRRIRKFFPGKGWFEGTVTSTSAGTGVEGAEREQSLANVRTAKFTRNGVVPPSN